MTQLEIGNDWFNAKVLQENNVKEIKILTEGQYVDGKFGRQFSIEILANGRKYKWTVSKTNQKILAEKYGMNTKYWIEKTVLVKTTQIMGKTTVQVITLNY